MKKQAVYLYTAGMKLIESHLPEQGELALDFGANNGKWTRPLSQHFKKVIAIEPDPRAYAMNKSKLPSNCEIIQAALDEKKGTVKYSVMPQSMNSKIGTRETAKKIIDVKTVTLEDFINYPVDFVKMDIEGHEVRVLASASAENFIKTLKPTLVIEPHGTKKRILDIMSKFSFYEAIHYKLPPGKGQIAFVKKGF